MKGTIPAGVTVLNAAGVVLGVLQELIVFEWVGTDDAPIEAGGIDDD